MLFLQQMEQGFFLFDDVYKIRILLFSEFNVKPNLMEKPDDAFITMLHSF